MKKILISSFDMEVGGVERSLISLLDKLDYKKYDIDLSQSYAYGDTAGDFTMLKSVGIPFAMNPTRELISKIMDDEELKEKINIIVERKDATYKLDVNSLTLI